MRLEDLSSVDLGMDLGPSYRRRNNGSAKGTKPTRPKPTPPGIHGEKPGAKKR